VDSVNAALGYISVGYCICRICIVYMLDVMEIKIKSINNSEKY